jgi:hypothetical protein
LERKEIDIGQYQRKIEHQEEERKSLLEKVKSREGEITDLKL